MTNMSFLHLLLLAAICAYAYSGNSHVVLFSRLIWSIFSGGVLYWGKRRSQKSALGELFWNKSAVLSKKQFPHGKTALFSKTIDNGADLEKKPPLFFWGGGERPYVKKGTIFVPYGRYFLCRISALLQKGTKIVPPKGIKQCPKGTI